MVDFSKKKKRNHNMGVKYEVNAKTTPPNFAKLLDQIHVAHC